MRIKVGDTFPILKFTAIAEFVSDTSVQFKLALVSHSGFTRSIFGRLIVQYPCEGTRRAVLSLAAPDKYHSLEALREIQEAAFQILDIPEDESWQMSAGPSEESLLLGPPAPGVIELTGSG